MSSQYYKFPFSYSFLGIISKIQCCKADIKELSSREKIEEKVSLIEFLYFLNLIFIIILSRRNEHSQKLLEEERINQIFIRCRFKCLRIYSIDFNQKKLIS